MKLLHIDALINEIQKACKDIIISCHRCFLAPQNFTEEASLSHNHTRLVVLNLQAIVFKLSSLCSFAEFRPVAKQFYWVRDCINRLRSSLISEWVEFWEFRCPLAANVLPLFDRKARMLLTFDETCFFLFEVSWVSMTSFSLIRIISYGVMSTALLGSRSSRRLELPIVSSSKVGSIHVPGPFYHKKMTSWNVFWAFQLWQSVRPGLSCWFHDAS